MAKKTIPVNNYNDSNNYGTSGAAPSLYSDKHYLDGDGFLYGLGMASQRMIVKGKAADIDTDHFAWTSASTTSKLILRVDSLVSGGLATADNGKRLAVNPGNGLYIDMINQNKLAVSLFKKQNTSQSTPYNASGLEFATGAEWGGAPAAGQLRIKLSETGSGTSYINTSGLVLKDPGDIGNLHVTEGLMVNYDNVTIGLNASTGQLEVKPRPTADGVYSLSGLKVYDTADAAGGVGLSVDINRNAHADNPLDIDVGGLFVDWERMISNIASNSSGNFNYYTDGQGHFGLSVVPGDGLQNNSQTKQLEVKLYTKISNNNNESGLIIASDSTTYTGGLKINCGKALSIGVDSTDTAAYDKLNVLYDNITIKLDNQNRLKVDATAITPNISPSDPITVNTSGHNKIIGLKLKNTTESGQTIYSSGLDADNNGLFVKLGDTSIANGNNGLYVDWAMAPWGVGLKYDGVSGKIKVKSATTSEIGGVKLGTDTAPDEGMNASTHYLLKDDSDAAYVNAYVYNSYPTTNAAEHYPYSAAYIISNYSNNTQIDTKIANAISDISGREYKIFIDLPAKGPSESWTDFYAAYKKYIALVSNTGSEPDAYKEYILIVTNESTSECHWEQIGDTEFTTDNFVAKTDVLTQAEVASIVKDVFGF